MTTQDLQSVLLAQGQAVLLRADGAQQLQEIAHRELLESWCELPADTPPLSSLIAQLFLPGDAARISQVIGALTGEAVVDLGTHALRGLHVPPRRIACSAWRTTSGDIALLLRETTAQAELQNALNEAQSALAAAMSALRARPKQLRMFLDSAQASVSTIRALLRTTARTQATARDKVSRLLEAAHALDDEARSAGVAPVAAACRTLRDALQRLLEQDTISGDALLPLAPLVDQVSHAVGITWRIEEQRWIEPARTAQKAATPQSPAGRRHADWIRSSERRWNLFLRQRGEETGVLARLSMQGATHVPEPLRRAVDEILQHLLGNAIEHGIETPEQRLACDKPATGQISVNFEPQGSMLRVTVRDDGRGFDVERIGRAAVRCGLLSEESLLERGAGDVVGLIFRPDFTTDGLDGVEGRGRGMTYLRRCITRLGGQISVATKPGRYTQFNLQLPATAAMAEDEPGDHALA